MCRFGRFLARIVDAAAALLVDAVAGISWTASVANERTKTTPDTLVSEHAGEHDRTHALGCNGALNSERGSISSLRVSDEEK